HRPAADPGVGAAGASPTRCASGPARGSGAGRVVPRYAPRGVRVRGTSVGLGQTLLAGAPTRAVARTGLAVAALRARPGVLARLPAGTGVLAARLVAAARAEGGADRGQGRGDRLEEGLPAVGAVAAATGGQADVQSVAGEHGAAAVAGLCAHVRLDEPGDRALGVVDGGVQAEHLAVGEAGGAAHPEHLLADGGLGGLADPDRLAADVDVAGRLGRRVVVLDEREVALAGEDGLVDGGDGRAALLVGPLVAAERAVTGRQEGRGAVARGDVEAQGAAGVGGEDGVTAGHEGPEGAGGLLDGGHAGAEALDGGFQAVPLVAGDGAVRGDQDLVGA